MEEKDQEYIVRSAWVQNIYQCCKVGEQLYEDLMAKLPEDADLVFPPAGLGDTLWILAFAGAYREAHGRRMMLALREAHAALLPLFPEAGLLAKLDEDLALMLRCYIVLNEKWAEGNFRYGYRHEAFGYDPDDNAFLIHWLPSESVYRNYAQMLKRALDLPLDAKATPATFPPLDVEMQQMFRNAVFLLPSQEKYSGIPDSFWQQFAQRIQEQGIPVYMHQGSVPQGMDVSSISTIDCSLLELMQLGQCMGLSIATRSSFSDLLAVSGARMAVLYTEDAVDAVYQPRSFGKVELSQEDLRDDVRDFGICGRVCSYLYTAQMAQELADSVLDRLFG